MSDEKNVVRKLAMGIIIIMVSAGLFLSCIPGGLVACNYFSFM